MRVASKIDTNQPAIVRALRQMGARVQVLSNVGKGFPDLLIAYRGVFALVEVKDGGKVPSAQKLTPDEERWHEEWQHEGPIFVVSSIDEAQAALEALVQP